MHWVIFLPSVRKMISRVQFVSKYDNHNTHLFLYIPHSSILLSGACQGFSDCATCTANGCAWNPNSGPNGGRCDLRCDDPNACSVNPVKCAPTDSCSSFGKCTDCVSKGCQWTSQGCSLSCQTGSLFCFSQTNQCVVSSEESGDDCSLSTDCATCALKKCVWNLDGPLSIGPNKCSNICQGSVCTYSSEQCNIQAQCSSAANCSQCLSLGCQWNIPTTGCLAVCSSGNCALNSLQCQAASSTALVPLTNTQCQQLLSCADCTSRGCVWSGSSCSASCTFGGASCRYNTNQCDGLAAQTSPCSPKILQCGACLSQGPGCFWSSTFGCVTACYGPSNVCHQNPNQCSQGKFLLVLPSRIIHLMFSIHSVLFNDDNMDVAKPALRNFLQPTISALQS